LGSKTPQLLTRLKSKRDMGPGVIGGKSDRGRKKKPHYRPGLVVGSTGSNEGGPSGEGR